MKSFIKKYLPHLWHHLKLAQRHWEEYSHACLQKKVKKILNSSTSPNTNRAEIEFQVIQDAYPPYPPYGYDEYSVWTRAASRSLEILRIEGMEIPGKKILEIGCGDGMVSYWLRKYGHQVWLTDAEDWRSDRAKDLFFCKMDINQKWEGLPETSFDLIFSYNSFEHFAEPAEVLRQMKEHLVPGGRIYLNFAPLYCSPWGLHAYNTLKMPYPQFLFSEDFIINKLNELGIRDLGKEQNSLQFTNRWRVNAYENLWKSSGMELETIKRLRTEEHLNMIARYPECFSGRALTLEDVTLYFYSLILKTL